ncbi:outer membrane protein [Labrys okinawensis]|uniref:outer membrane protein n=1 Tax=Labrys okinawensis TaxID=346911 RepID=UPI0039BCFFC3
MNRLILASVSLLALSSAAFAADLAPAPAEPVAPVVVPFTWTGFYGGVQAAYSWGQSDTDNYQIAGHILDYKGSNDSDGFSAGGYIGANYQFENTNFVVGAEVDAKFGAIDGDGVLTSIPPGRPDSPSSARMTWDGAARLRVGYAIDRFLPYIAGGVAGTEFKWRPIYPIDKAVPHKTDMWGWTIGAGVEYAITDNIIARVEYRYTDYGDKDELDFKPTAGGLFNDHYTLKTNDVRVGVAYKF